MPSTLAQGLLLLLLLLLLLHRPLQKIQDRTCLMQWQSLLQDEARQKSILQRFASRFVLRCLAGVCVKAASAGAL